MSLRSTRIVFAAGTLALALVAVLLSSPLHAQGEPSAEILVGTYQPQQVAEAVGFQQKVMQDMQGLQQRAQQAQQEGDQEALQQLQVEAQQIEQQAAARFLADIDAVMPQVAEAAGAHVVVTDVTYAAPGVATEDLTEAVIEALGAEVAPAAEPQ